MEQLKIRMWNSEKKQMEYPEFVNCVDGTLDRDSFPLMLNTNVYDIYEGDILYGHELDQYLEVYYSDGAFQILFNNDDEGTVLTKQIVDANYLEVVGNIYENEELVMPK